MSTQAESTTTSESCGIAGADEFIAKARELGLSVDVKRVTTAATVRDGREILPETLNVSVVVKMTIPEELQDTNLGLVERCTSLTSYWLKRQTPRARGRWVLANYSTLGSHEDLHVMHRVYSKLEWMADDMGRLQRLV